MELQMNRYIERLRAAPMDQSTQTGDRRRSEGAGKLGEPTLREWGEHQTNLREDKRDQKEPKQYRVT